MFLIPFIATGIRDSGLGGESRSDFVSSVASWGKFCSLCPGFSNSLGNTNCACVHSQRVCGQAWDSQLELAKRIGWKNSPKNRASFPGFVRVSELSGFAEREGGDKRRKEERKEGSKHVLFLYF